MMKLLLTLGLAALAGSVAAETEGIKYQKIADIARISAEKYHKKAAVYTSIADNHEEAAVAWHRYEEHRLDLVAHNASKEQTFTDFLTPMIEAEAAQKADYELELKELDDALQQEKHKHERALALEVERFYEFSAAIQEQKNKLTHVNQEWIDNHEIEWNSKAEVWNDNWDAVTQAKVDVHDDLWDSFLTEAEEADALGTPCQHRFNDDEAQDKKLWFLKENLKPGVQTSSGPRNIAVKGRWNTVHAEFVSRSMEDGEYFELSGNSKQVGVGLCIEECEADAGIRFKKNCVGFYGDGGDMLTFDGSSEVTFPSGSNYRGPSPGFTYHKTENCLTYKRAINNECISLPAHFEGSTVRAVGQVWNGVDATITSER